MYISSQIRSALNKTQILNKGKDRRCAGLLFMSDVSVLCKSCVAHLAKLTTLFDKFKCFD